MWVKVTLRYHLTPIIVRNTKHSTHWRGYGESGALCSAGDATWCSRCRTVWRSSKNKNRGVVWPSDSIRVATQKNRKQGLDREGCAHALYHGHSSVIHRSQKVETNNCPAANDLADKMWSVRAIGCCLSVAKLCLTLCDPVDCSARQASLSFTISWSLLKLMSVESVMSSNQLILCRPLLHLPSIFPSIGVFSNELTLCIRWSKYWNFNTIGYLLLSLKKEGNSDTSYNMYEAWGLMLREASQSQILKADKYYTVSQFGTADGDCSHEIKRRLLLGRKVMTNLNSILKSRDITLPTRSV